MSGFVEKAQGLPATACNQIIAIDGVLVNDIEDFRFS